MAYETLNFDLADGVATITLNRPDAANSMDLQMGKDLMDVSIACGENKDVRAVLLTGEGSMFCAGGDLRSFSQAGDGLPALVKELTIYLHAAVSQFARMRAPMIVAVNGTAAGAGMSLAVTGDIVYAARSAKFTMAYTAAGLSPDGSSSYFLPRLIGLRRTQELMITNRRLTADEAYDWGLVNAVFDDEALMDEALALTRKLAAGATGSYGVVKKLLCETFTNPLETQMEIEGRAITASARSRDGVEGIDAFLNKRAPVFTGQ